MPPDVVLRALKLGELLARVVQEGLQHALLECAELARGHHEAPLGLKYTGY